MIYCLLSVQKFSLFSGDHHIIFECQKFSQINFEKVMCYSSASYVLGCHSVVLVGMS